ncbi:chain A, solution structure Of The Ibr Domain Of The RING finger protein 31 protein, putative [Ixodes scapularis]|uniref:Chain A, solution structure Of The Ibr Domain Of The RING finger protein 31 protein, putative n=1 Tax=Ixodes scapularis TaxID=6945 RepID=B7PVI0_IXOSC|nr:chain A, solution structure Of The Ibr Domain Of The RING finger protein 31 protein, putative [Ixodes scapularis]|eukprot:XP_002407990.1 chain A, solution structure Of The Ibr Domain Of The RING finger protein 31 protein, putative [Ixodes scapularis]
MVMLSVPQRTRPPMKTLNKLKPLLTRDEWEGLNKSTLERCLEDDPDFRRCSASKCEYGFLTDPGLQKVQCPECGLVMCNTCSSPWRREHENVTCEAFREWKRCNDPDDPDYQAEEYIRTNGISGFFASRQLLPTLQGY